MLKEDRLKQSLTMDSDRAKVKTKVTKDWFAFRVWAQARPHRIATNTAYSLHCSSFLGLPFRILNTKYWLKQNKELQWRLYR